MGLKLNCKEDLEALKNIVPGYKEESHVHELIIPSETAVWNEEDIPLSESTDQGSQQSNTLTMNTDLQVTQNNNSGSE